MGRFLPLLQVDGSRFLWSIYEGILPDIGFLLPVRNFLNVIDPTQIVRPLQTDACSSPSPFPSVRFK